MTDARGGSEHTKARMLADARMIESFVNRADDRKGCVVTVERARCDLPALFNCQNSINLRVDWLFRISAIRKEPVERFAIAPARMRRSSQRRTLIDVIGRVRTAASSIHLTRASHEAM